MMKNLLNLMKEQKRKLKGLIDKKPLKFDEENEKKTQSFVTLFIRGEKPSKPS